MLPSHTGGPLERQQTTRLSRTLRPARHRLRRGSAGGRPVSYNTERYKDRNAIKRSEEQVKQWRGLATHYDDTRRHLPRRRRPIQHHPLAPQPNRKHALVTSGHLALMCFRRRTSRSMVVEGGQ